MLTEEQKLEIGRMLQEGVSVEGIRTVVASWQPQSVAQQHGYFDAVMGERYYTRKNDPIIGYAAFIEYGLPPLDESKTVEGTIEKENGGD